MLVQRVARAHQLCPLPRPRRARARAKAQAWEKFYVELLLEEGRVAIRGAKANLWCTEANNAHLLCDSALDAETRFQVPPPLSSLASPYLSLALP